ncbi:hypothetical protein [Mangrovibacterium marinum]|nr:hypothetical protein [Mangrovibacterium marinum]
MKQEKIVLNLEELIMVEEPYNILQDLEVQDDGSIRATVVNEYIDRDEGGPMGGGECGRHLAILGSIVLAHAYNHKKRHYYLAVHALLSRKSDQVFAAEELLLTAKPTLMEKRKGTVYGELLSADNEVIFTAEVEYLVMSPAVFTKFYGKYQVDTPVHNGVSPYINRRHLSDITLNGERATGEFGIVQASECEGHFRNYPALPVALIGNLFGELGFALFKHNVPGFKRIISPRTSIRAYRLAFTGEHVRFVGRISKYISDDTIQVTAEAKVGDEIVSNVEFELRGVNP